jgi:hypothetical protein
MSALLELKQDLPDVNKFIKELNYETPVCSSPFEKYKDNMYRKEEWAILENKIKNFVEKNVITKDGYLKKGLKFYHSTLNSDLNFEEFEKHKMTFFGLDIVISLWYIMEMAESQKKYEEIVEGKNPGELPDYGYLYEFELVKPLKVDKYIESINNHPGSDRDCYLKLGVCVHPQITFHGKNRENQGPFDMSIEVTLGHTSLSYLGLLKRYKVSVENLNKFKSYPLTSLDIVSYTDNGDDMLTFIKTSDLRNVELPSIPNRESISKNFFNFKSVNNNNRNSIRKSVRKTRKSVRKTRKSVRKTRKSVRKTRKSVRKTRKSNK